MTAGLVAGPLTPPDLFATPQQSTRSWLTRLAFLAGVETPAGLLMNSRNFHRAEHRSTAHELSLAYRRTQQTFASLVEVRDEQTAHHCERAALNADRLGTEIGLNAHDMTDLYWPESS